MSISLLKQPGSIEPVYNPNIYEMYEAASPVIPGYRFIFGLFETGETVPYATFRLAPDSNGEAILDISKVLQTKVNNPLMIKTGESETICLNDSYYSYDLKIKKEYFIFKSFLDYEFVSSGPFFQKTKLTTVGAAPYSVGDLVTVKISSSITDNRKNLNGTFQVLEVTSGYFVIDLLFDIIGSGPTTPGTTWYFDQRKYSYDWGDGDTFELDGQMVYNEAVSFKDFPTWTDDLILPDTSGEPIGEILTNVPNAIAGQYNPVYPYYLPKAEDRFIVKPYQNLYWNFFDNESGLVNSLVAVTDAGTIFIKPGCGTSTMKQWDISPNSDWTNITPAFQFDPYNPPNYDIDLLHTITPGMPYTHIPTKWYDVFPVQGQGFQSCDAIDVTITRTVDSVTTSTTYRAYASGGYLGKRRYEFVAEGKNYVVRYGGSGQWRLETDEYYNVIPVMTNNTTPYGTASATSNNSNAWKAFDGNPATSWVSTTGFENAILTYEFESSANITVYGYKMKKPSTTTNAVKSWTIQIKGYGGGWTTVDTVTNNTSLSEVTRYFGGWSGVTGIRIYPNAIIAGTQFECPSLELLETKLVAHMASSNDCPYSGGFLFWQKDQYVGPSPAYSYSISTASVDFNSNPTLKPVRIYLDHSCSINTTQLLFLDRSGSWSSFAFPLRQIESGTNTKLNYRNQINFYGNDHDIYNTWDSENSVYSSTVEKTYTLTTDWLTTGMSDYFEELITSPEVYIKLVSETTDNEEETPWLACTVVDSTFVNPKQKNKRLINRTVTVKLNSNNPINV